MPAPGAELRQAVFRMLGADAPLKALVGTRILDQSAADQVFPAVTFGRTSLYDWSSGAEKENEQLFTLHAWSKGGDAETLEIMAILRGLLDNASLELDDGRAVTIRLEFAEARYHEELSVHHALLRFRAISD